MKRNFSFYEFAGILAPGAVALIGLRHALPDLATYLAKDEFTLGDLGIFLILAYVLGHLVQSVGNLMERVWWSCWKGMPTQWVRKENCDYLSDSQLTAIPERFSALLGMSVKPPKEYKEKQWHSLVRQVVSALHQKKAAERIEIFNGNYGLCRGIAAAILVAVLALFYGNGWDAWKEAIVGGVLFVLAVYRMHRFACHYAREVYVQALQLSKAKKNKKGKEGKK